MTLKKHDIVLQVKEMGYTQEQSAEIVESLLPIIKSSLENGEDVLVSGFGKFAVKKKSQRKGRNPATGEDMYLDARNVVIFKCSGKLRERISGGG